MKVLVACEFSGVVRDAFAARGHDALSVDLLASERPDGAHLQANLWELPPAWFAQFDLMVAHPPCTYLAVSGARWFAQRLPQMFEALEFVKFLMNAPVPRIALENPVSVISSHICKPTQIVQPWQFGHGETKAICLWLKGLPKLEPTDVVAGRVPRVHHESPSPERWKNRSRFFTGIAAAMADQWGFGA